MPTRRKPMIELRHYSLPLNFPILLLNGERWRISDIKSGRLHFHNCLEIGVCHSDSGIMEFEDVFLPFKAGDITCIPKNLPHTTYSSPGTGSLWSYIFVDPEELFRNMPNALPQSFDRPMAAIRDYHLIMNRDKYPKFYYLATAIIEELTIQNSAYQTSVRGLMLALYVEILRIYLVKDKPKGESNHQVADNILVISNALDYIHENYMNPINIEDLANLCHLSISHFRRTFHEIIGAAPLNYLNSTRIDAACLLLKSTEDSILTISGKVGFHSISSFGRCFIKLMGVPPNVWRKQALLTESHSPIASILKIRGWI